MITVDEVHEALNRGEFYLEYMPIVSLKDGRCVGAEALSRWRRGSEVIPPDQFIPLIEQTAVAGQLTYWVIETVGSELGAWLRDHRQTFLSINIPPPLLGRGGIEYAVMKSGLMDLHRQIILEVTERGLPDQQGLGALEFAARLGVRVALDDVTLSGANLAVLSRCQLDIVKLDRGLVSQITPQCRCPGWLAGLTALLQATRLDVIAEGVETEFQFASLSESGLAMAQGFYFSPPVGLEEFKAYHEARSA